MNAAIEKRCSTAYARRQGGGFTLVELTAVAALLALLTSAAFITYNRTWQNWSLRQHAEQFYLAARYARVLAIESGRPCQLVIDPDNKAYYIVQAAPDSDETTAVSNLWHRPGKLADSVSFEGVMVVRSESLGESGSAITFYPEGRADAATVRLTNGQRAYTIQISAATARATLLVGDDETYDPDQIDLDAV
ncbi:MAG: hypothetical protein GX298_08090 [Planctomycetes bacterium]|jgi:type II secretion system protein H|nr:hypothetical protein [Planctomycetota bacterium]